MDLLIQRYDQTIMNNISRAEYVECMIAVALGSEWQLTWQKGWEWAPWDCEHRTRGARIEIKQAAATQKWTHDSTNVKRVPSFDIAPRTGYWPEDGGEWIDSPGRPADLYVFAWHALKMDVDQRDPSQWVFFVIAESDLPTGQKSISLNRLKALTESCVFTELPNSVDQKLRILGSLKKDTRPQP